VTKITPEAFTALAKLGAERARTENAPVSQAKRIATNSELEILWLTYKEILIEVARQAATVARAEAAADLAKAKERIEQLADNNRELEKRIKGFSFGIRVELDIEDGRINVVL
jgi:hypothetical protein